MIQHTFYGVVVDGSFTTFEFRETEGTVEDPKIIFVDDVTIGLVDGVVNRPPEGVIVQPTAAVHGGDRRARLLRGRRQRSRWRCGDRGLGLRRRNDLDGSRAGRSRASTGAGSYTVTFTATDDKGLADPTPDSRLVTVTDQPPAAPTGVVAGVANFPGALGSDWHTDLFSTTLLPARSRWS